MNPGRTNLSKGWDLAGREGRKPRNFLLFLSFHVKISFFPLGAALRPQKNQELSLKSSFYLKSQLAKAIWGHEWEFQCTFPVKFPKDFPPHAQEKLFGDFFFFFGNGGERKEELMSLEPLPWQPVANGSLGFPLHLQPRFLGISFPWQRMAPIPPGPPPCQGTKSSFLHHQVGNF